MSYQSYAENEFELALEFKDIKVPVIRVLDIISEEGHSGGSMNVFSSMFSSWAKDPKKLTENELFNPIWEVVKDLNPIDRSRVLMVIGKLMTFTPLSNLTGEDNEWVIHDYNDELYAQNKRLGSVFKQSNGTAYRTDMTVYYEPTSDYSNFVGYTSNCEEDKKVITFPYDPLDEPKKIYYKDRDSKELIPVNIDPHIWLKKAQVDFNMGFDVNTGEVVEQAHFVNKNNLDILIEVYNVLSKILDGLDKDNIDYFFNDLNYYVPKSKFFTATIELNKEFDLSTLTKNTTKVFTKVDDSKKITVTLESIELVRNLIRLFKSKDPSQTKLVMIEVLEPTKNYQAWVPKGKYHVDLLLDNSIAPTSLFYDKNCYIENLPNRYLYKKCKELGLEYKGLRN